MLQYNDLKEKPRKVSWLLAFILLVGLVGGLAMLFLLVQPDARQETSKVILDGNAMEPSLPRGTSVGFGPQPLYNRGDIIWFNDPQAGASVRHVRRVIGVEGDQVQLTGGSLLLNGQTVNEPYLKSPSPPLDYGPVTVGAGQLFVLADNRANSQDSRQWGPISLSSVRGALVK